MKKIIGFLVVFSFFACLFSCNPLKQLPLPEVQDGLRGDLGVDKNINEETIDDYLNREDSVYRDMRMLVDEANYEAIGGDSYLSGFISGFEVVPYPYICNVDDLPEEIGETYTGVTLFTLKDGNYTANYKESVDIIESLFPRDKYIFLMCGAGGYAGKTKKLLVDLGYDENKIYNVGGYWYYNGNNKVDVKYEENGETHYNFSLVNYHDIYFDTLTMVHESGKEVPIEEKITDTDFIKLNNLQDLIDKEFSKETFPLFVFLSGCPSCSKFLPIVKKYSKDNDIQMYCIDLHDIWGNDNSVTSRIKYAPSMFIYKDGQVVAYLDSESEDDYKYYQDESSLSEWFNSHIDISLFNKCSSCTIN